MKKLKSAVMGALVLGLAAFGTGAVSAQSAPTLRVNFNNSIATMSFNAQGDLLIGRYGGAHPNWTSSVIAGAETSSTVILNDPVGKQGLFLKDGRIVTTSNGALNVQTYDRVTKTAGPSSLFSNTDSYDWVRAVNSAGNIYSIRSTANNPTPITVTTPAGVTTTIAIPTLVSFPESIGADSVGNVYAGLRDGTILRWAEGTGIQTTVRAADGGGIKGIAFDGNDNMFVSLTDQGKIVKYAAGSTVPVDFLNISLPGILAVNGQTLYLVSDPNSARIYTYDLVVPVPTMSEWAMILMAVLLAGGAVVYLQRRRMTA